MASPPALNPGDTTIAINWVGTNIIYDSTVVKKDHSIIFFFAKWCGYCKKMDSITFRDPGVSRIIYESFNMARIDIESDSLVVYYDTTMTCKDLAKNIYKVPGIPMSCFFTRNGEYLGPLLGYKSPSDFASLLLKVRDGL